MSPTVADYPQYDRVNDLIRDLKAQNFDVEEGSDAFIIKSPYVVNGPPLRLHKTPSDPRWSVNNLATLKNMGFHPPSVAKHIQKCPTCGWPFTGPMTLTQHRIEEHGFTLTCKVCEQTGFTSVKEHRQHLTEHRREAKQAEKQAAATPEPETSDEPVVKTEPVKAAPKIKGKRRSPVRRGYVEEIAHFIQLVDTVKEDLDEVVDAYKELYKLHQGDKKRINEIENLAGRMVGKF